MMMMMIEEWSGFHLVDYCASSSFENTPLELHHAHKLYDNVVDHGDDDDFDDVDDHGDGDHEEENVQKEPSCYLLNFDQSQLQAAHPFLLRERCKKKGGGELTSVSFMYVCVHCVAGNGEMLVFFFLFFPHQ